MAILVTGGAGYIGSHTVVELMAEGMDVVILDDFSNSYPEAVDRIKSITAKDVKVYKADIRNKNEIQAVFTKEQIETVVHFAGFKAVGESVSDPLKYHLNNVAGTINLLEVMDENKVYNFVFSSSATVYGDPESSPVPETAKVQPENTYGETKLSVERILTNLAASPKPWHCISLRYFNPIGAHSSGLIGEDPQGIPNNLMPFISQVAVGRLEQLSVFGDDYPTPDGTGVRDYVHVVDLAKGHVKAIQAIDQHKGANVYNLGTGKGISVLEMIHAFESENQKQIPYVITDRRPGDVALYYADPSKAEANLGWKAEKDLKDMVRDSWRWQSNNPNGYRSS